MGQLFAQSESLAVSVIILLEERSMERILAEKSPFSVWTVTELYPAPGGPLITGAVGFGEGEVVGFGETEGITVGVEVGDNVGEGDSVGVDVGEDCGAVCLEKR